MDKKYLPNDLSQELVDTNVDEHVCKPVDVNTMYLTTILGFWVRHMLIHVADVKGL